ncbi:ABC transporter permease [Nitrospirillum sp. BR 11163]|uniref:ABC transporter permease n=1 Tax=Nitrospirillum sp. BR 11163 TaxID=3104323 RepID=UPI002AFE08A7|nr:ABC transporter permease [Nitrospirillum sp. BR 11163]MEA1674639.1 ABC transporter permease [Nitrospirillum sp. BR 11163]
MADGMIVLSPRARGLGRFILVRLAQVVPVVLGIAVLNFFILHLAPGDIVDVLAGDSGGATPEYMAELRHRFGLDQPVWVQFYRYLLNLAQFNFGYAYRHGMPVFALIASRLPSTLLLMGVSLLLTVTVSTALGVLSATRVRTWVDQGISILVLVAHSIPGFWLGLMAIVLFSAKLGWLPSGGMVSLDRAGQGWGALVLDVARHLVLPAATLAVFYLAVYTRLVRSSLLELHGADFVRTARAKGAGEARVILVHALRNALLPLVTMLGYQLASLLSGSVVVESVFGWPGLGRLIFDAVLARDLNLLLGILFLSSILVTLLNVAVDVAYRLLDPRVAVGGRR